MVGVPRQSVFGGIIRHMIAEERRPAEIQRSPYESAEVVAGTVGLLKERERMRAKSSAEEACAC
ncbi:MAG: hypothetical protein ACYC6C_05445 [Coriobacteriia bacterium]